MGDRGRQSGASLAVFRPDGITAVSRPPPPGDLTPEQADEWLKVVNRMPAQWFPDETHPTLAQYCRHIITARRVAQAIEKLAESEEFDLANYDQLLRMQERESRALIALARSMRIAQSATYSKDKKKGPATKRPWD